MAYTEKGVASQEGSVGLIQQCATKFRSGILVQSKSTDSWCEKLEKSKDVSILSKSMSHCDIFAIFSDRH